MSEVVVLWVHGNKTIAARVVTLTTFRWRAGTRLRGVTPTTRLRAPPPPIVG